MFGRFAHRCALIPGSNKLVITGGYDEYLTEPLKLEDQPIRNSVEIISIEDGSLMHIVSNPMNVARYSHGIGVVTIDDEDRLAVFGGWGDRGIAEDLEVFNFQTQTWEVSDKLDWILNF